VNRLVAILMAVMVVGAIAPTVLATHDNRPDCATVGPDYIGECR
jgi:hypothetical protein